MWLVGHVTLSLLPLLVKESATTGLIVYSLDGVWSFSLIAALLSFFVKFTSRWPFLGYSSESSGGSKESKSNSKSTGTKGTDDEKAEDKLVTEPELSSEGEKHEDKMEQQRQTSEPDITSEDEAPQTKQPESSVVVEIP